MNDIVLEPAPDYAEPLEGWRVWRVVADTECRLNISSVFKPTVWPAGEPLVAECLHRRLLEWWPWRPRPHSAPDQWCQCGIYATQLEHLAQYLEGGVPRGAVARVFGRVALWGMVVECERGFRASHAYPMEIYVPVGDTRDDSLGRDELASHLAEYGVPVVVLEGRSEDAHRLLRRTRLSRAH